jgi:hypothetical protein
MEPSATTRQIQGPVVVMPLDEYRQLRARYDRERAERFERLLAIAARNRGVSPEQVEADVNAAVGAARNLP